MKTFLECTDLAAREIGDTGFKNWLIFKLDAEQLENLERAAVIYAEQSNSHKHGVMQVPDSKCQFCQGTGLDQMDINVQLAKNQGTAVGDGAVGQNVCVGDKSDCDKSTCTYPKCFCGG